MIVGNDDKFNQTEASILWFLFNRVNHEIDIDDIEVIAAAVSVDKTLCALTVAKLMNDGYVAKIVGSGGRATYVLSLQGFEYMYGLDLT